MMCCTTSNLNMLAHTAEVNWWPWSEVRVEGTPNLANHVPTRASIQAVVSMERRGTASNHLVDLSTIVNRYW